MNEAIKQFRRPILHWHYFGLAFFWASSMLTFRSSILLTGSANTPDNNTFIVVVSFVANMTILFAISALVEKAPKNLAKMPSWVFCAAILAGLVLVRIAGEPLVGNATLIMLFIGALLCGIGYGYFWGSWADVLGRIHPSTTTISIPISFLLTAVLFVAITLSVSFAEIPGILLIFPLPILSLLCLERCRKDETTCKVVPTSDSKHYIKAIASLVPLIIASLVLSCLFGFMWETTVLSTHTATEAHEFPLIANIIAALILICAVLIARRKVDLTLVYQILIPISILLFIAIPFFWHEQPIILNAISSAIYGIFDVIIWYLVASTSFDFAVSGFVIGGLVRGISILSRLIGIGIGYLVVLDSNIANGAMIGLCIGAVYILAMLLWFLYQNASRKTKVDVSDLDIPETAACANEANSKAFRHDEVSSQASQKTACADKTSDQVSRKIVCADKIGSQTSQNDETNSQISPNDEVSKNTDKNSKALSADQDSLTKIATNNEDEKLRLIAEDYGLTRREAEVLPYLARGRSAKVIAQALFVSEPTIRTHTRRILEKTCLHSKQELIDLVEKY